MKINNAILTIATALYATAASANGSHAAGHGHDDARIGEAGKASQVTRSIQVEMRDTMRFTPANFTVKQGETIRFVVKNSGILKHEFVLGTDKDLKAHYEVMKKFPEMEHEDANMLSVEPQKTGEMIWKFSKAGPVSIACLHPGHYDAGMKGLIQVSANNAASKTVETQDAQDPAAEMTAGEVRKIDKEARKITLKHGEIKSLEMPPMTMVFTVKNPALFGALKVGDKVTFSARREDGKIVVTELQSTP